jgi:drug/metabolite transporter (DMT)-like permease
VAGAAAFQYPRKRLLSVIAASRFVRFSIDGLLAILFGTRIIRWTRAPEFLYVMVGLIVISLIGSALSIYSWIRGSRKVVGRRGDSQPEPART